MRVAVAALLGVAGCGAALWALQVSGVSGFSFDGDVLLNQGGYIAAAQAGILILTALALLLLIDSAFTKHVGEYVAVILMAATGGLLISGAQDLLVIFVSLELLSLGYISSRLSQRVRRKVPNQRSSTISSVECQLHSCSSDLVISME